MQAKSSPARLKRSELRELLLDAGVELLREEGMELGLGRLTFPRVFDRIETATGRRITGASVYERLWATQSAYQWEALAALIDRADVVDPRTQRHVARLLARADVGTPEARLMCLRELCRAVVERHVMGSTSRPEYRIVLAAVAGVATRDDPDGAPDAASVERVRDALSSYLEREADFFHELYMTIGSALGLRTIAPLELRQFVLAVGALGEGLALRLNYFPEYGHPIMAPPRARDGEPEVWSLAGFGVEAIVHAMIELDPDWPGPDR